MGNTASSEAAVGPLQTAPVPEWAVALSAMKPEEKKVLFASIEYKKQQADVKAEREVHAKGIVNVEDDVTYEQLKDDNSKLNADIFLNIKAYEYRTGYTTDTKRNMQKRILVNVDSTQFEKWKYIQDVRLVQKQFGNNFPDVPFVIRNEFPELYKTQEVKREKNRKRREEKPLQ